MHRRKFIRYVGFGVLGVGSTAYLLSDKYNVERDDIKLDSTIKLVLQKDESDILYLASLAPSGHNTQPWLVTHIEPYHWIICNDKTKWLPAVDPTQRETVLSLGAFLQNLEYAAGHYGYACQWNLLATNNQDERIMIVKLAKMVNLPAYDVEQIKSRRTVRSDFRNEAIKKEDLKFLIGEDEDKIQYAATGSKESTWLDAKTIEANQLQTYRDAAQQELASWIRFSSKEATKHYDGLTTASMEINGISGMVVRNFYDSADVMKKSFREKSLETVREQIGQSAGWLIITSKNNSVAALIETGMRMQRLFLKVRSKGIALHPMTQILEEEATNKIVNASVGIANPIQFLLRVGYVSKYPEPVSLRRPVDRFVKV